jgi:hypothetical protein
MVIGLLNKIRFRHPELGGAAKPRSAAKDLKLRGVGHKPRSLRSFAVLRFAAAAQDDGWENLNIVNSNL